MADQKPQQNSPMTDEEVRKATEDPEADPGLSAYYRAELDAGLPLG